MNKKTQLTGMTVILVILALLFGAIYQTQKEETIKITQITGATGQSSFCTGVTHLAFNITGHSFRVNSNVSIEDNFEDNTTRADWETDVNMYINATDTTSAEGDWSGNISKPGALADFKTINLTINSGNYSNLNISFYLKYSSSYNYVVYLGADKRAVQNGDGYFYIQAYRTGNILRLYNRAGTYNTICTPFLNNGEWVRVGVEFLTGDMGVANFYCNGTRTVTAGTSRIADPQNISAILPSLRDGWGLIDDIRIYNMTNQTFPKLTQIPATNQSTEGCAFKLTNNGTSGSADVYLKINETHKEFNIRCSNDTYYGNSTNYSTANTWYYLYQGLPQGVSVNVSCWQDRYHNQSIRRNFQLIPGWDYG